MYNIGDKDKEPLEITEDMVMRVIAKLKIDQSPGLDKIHNRVMKRSSTSPDYFFSKSRTEGCIPIRWKEAEVTPIYKKGSKSDPNKYRPVSLTSTWCKVMKTIVRDNFMEHIKKFNMLTENQHDFRQKRSCCTQLLKTVHDWAKAEDISSPVDVIYLDYRKAFDSVSHERLLEKLKFLGDKLFN